jgi:(2R)-ethylmalonyl-CoA mutase
VFGPSISFFVNAGIRFVEEMCKMRAFTQLWDRIGQGALRRHRRQGPPLPLRRAGEQPGPHRGPAGEQRAAHRARDAGGHAVARTPGPAALQLPAWNEALGLPRPWDQQWSLRMQQVLAFETDLLEYDDLFAGSM